MRWRHESAGTVVSRTPFLRVGFNQGQTGAIEHGLAFRQQLLDWLAHHDLLCSRSRSRCGCRYWCRYQCNRGHRRWNGYGDWNLRRLHFWRRRRFSGVGVRRRNGRCSGDDRSSGHQPRRLAVSRRGSGCRRRFGVSWCGSLSRCKFTLR